MVYGAILDYRSPLARIDRISKVTKSLKQDEEVIVYMLYRDIDFPNNLIFLEVLYLVKLARHHKTSANYIIIVIYFQIAPVNNSGFFFYEKKL